VKAKANWYTVGGKTGTAQRFDAEQGKYLNEAYVCSFIGFLPVETPQLLILVTIDAPQNAAATGGSVAAPIFRNIAERAAIYRHIEPSRHQPQRFADRGNPNTASVAPLR